MYYYGARYYDPKISIWLSVDPLAEQTPNWSPYVYCNNNPVNMIDPDGRSTSPIYDNKTGEYLGVDSQGFLRGDVLFMDKQKFNELSDNGKIKIDHKVAKENSLSIANLPDTKEGAVLYGKAVDHISKALYKLYYHTDIKDKLAGGKVQVMSENLNIGTKYADRLDGDYGVIVNYYGNVERVTLAFDHRRVFNTAANIFTLFEHEFHGHGILGHRQRFGKPDCHGPIYKMSVNSPNFKYTTGTYRQHTIDNYNAFHPNEQF